MVATRSRCSRSCRARRASSRRSRPGARRPCRRASRRARGSPGRGRRSRPPGRHSPGEPASRPRRGSPWRRHPAPWPDPVEVVTGDHLPQLGPGGRRAGRITQDRRGPVRQGDTAVGRAPAPLAEPAERAPDGSARTGSAGPPRHRPQRPRPRRPRPPSRSGPARSRTRTGAPSARRHQVSPARSGPIPAPCGWSRSARLRPRKAAGSVPRSAARAGLAARMRRSVRSGRPGRPRAPKARREKNSSGRPGAASGLWSKAAQSW